MNHPLDGAYLRLDWACKRLAELKEVSRVFIESEYDEAGRTTKFYSQSRGQASFEFAGTGNDIPQDFACLIGEVVYHLRSSLDYLVYELAKLDSGSAQSGTQFPIEDTANQFWGQAKGRLRGVNVSHAAEIEKLQPYNGVNWTKALRSISNPDKHRHLIIGKNQVQIATARTNDAADIITSKDVGGLVFTVKIRDRKGAEMYVQLHVTFFVALDNGIPVIQVLEEIKTGVANVLADFKPEF